MIKDLIHKNAGEIMNILNDLKWVSISELKEISDLNEFEIHLALGWLAKENKILFQENYFNYGNYSGCNLAIV
jgi:hypothetical protein